MNSIVSGTAIEPIMQRMSSVEDDHASVVSNDDEDSSRDTHDEVDDVDDEQRRQRQDPSEKPDDLVVGEGVVASENNIDGVQLPVAPGSVVGSDDGGVIGSPSVADVDSPMMVVNDDDDDDGNEEDDEDVDGGEEVPEREEEMAAASVLGGSDENSSDNTVASAAVHATANVVASNHADDASAIAVTDRIFEQARVEIALLSAAVDVLSRRRNNSGSENSPSGGAVRTRRHVSSPSMNGPSATTGTQPTTNSARFWPYQLPSAGVRPNQPLQPQGSVSASGQQNQASPNVSRRRIAPLVSFSTTTSNAASATPAPAPATNQPQPQQQQQQQAQGSNLPPQQVIRSAIVGNRTIITTKTPSKFPFSAELKQAGAAILGDRYILLDLCDGTSLYKCIDVKTKEEFVCKIANNPCTSLLEAHFRLDHHPHINPFRKVIHGAQHTYLLFEPSQGDLHSYVRIRKRLREAEAKRLFRQMCETVKACHDQGIVLRDLKLRKFIFADEEKTQLRLESLEDAVVLEDPRDDLLQDKRGCPAYVSPEILKANTTYSGKAADMWSLGVILYTMLVGRYPFNDSEHASLFAKISRGHFHVPECLSSKARCVIRALLRKHPEERITSEDLLHHPWLTKENFRESVRSCSDQMVPLHTPKRSRRDGGDEADAMPQDLDMEYEERDETREGGQAEQDGVPVMGSSLLSARFGAIAADSMMATSGGGGGGGGSAGSGGGDSASNSFVDWWLST